MRGYLPLNWNTALFAFVRSLLVASLCGMALLGHAPAWVHVADGSHGCVGQDCFGSVCQSKPRIIQRCPATCCGAEPQTAATDASDGEAVADDIASDSPTPHDPGTCPVCQFLTVPSGVGSPVVWAPVGVVLNAPAIRVRSLRPHGVVQRLIHPRGPPSQIV